MKNKIDDFLEGVKTVAIAGHVNPDGDCVGSCLGTYLYLTGNFPELEVKVYMEPPRSVFSYIGGFDAIRYEVGPEEGDVDLFILLDISSKERIGAAKELLPRAKKTLCFDHHVTSRDSYTWIINHPEASSASEVVWNFFDEEKISEKCAEALYTGIAHDTGVFQYSCTSPKTMRIAAGLMEKGIPFSKIVDDTFYQKTYVQNQIMGRALMESILMFDGQLIVGFIRRKDMDFYGVTPKDMDGIVSQLRNTAGVEVSIYMYELTPNTYKVSLRSKERVDVSRIAQIFGGGGHVRAAGCTMQGTPYDCINSLTAYLEKDLK